MGFLFHVIPVRNEGRSSNKAFFRREASWAKISRVSSTKRVKTSWLHLKNGRTLWLKAYPHVVDSQPGSFLLGPNVLPVAFPPSLIYFSTVNGSGSGDTSRCCKWGSVDADGSFFETGLYLVCMCVYMYIYIYMYRVMYCQSSWLHRLPSFPRSKLLPSSSYFWDVLVQQCQCRMKINTASCMIVD